MISFGCIVWMLEKAGVPPELPCKHREPAIQCVQNITHWWFLEHIEHPKNEPDLSFPGEVMMLQGLMLATLWLGMHEYGGIWWHGSSNMLFTITEELGFLGNVCTMAIHEVLKSYHKGEMEWKEPTWCLGWYHAEFDDWAEEVVAVEKDNRPFKLETHQPGQENWCRVYGCPYPYVLDIKVFILDPRVTHRGIVNDEKTVMTYVESCAPNFPGLQWIYPRWGAYLREDNFAMLECRECLSVKKMWEESEGSMEL
jgi:hypothetical protein